ncbi:RIO1 family regulatory kinase/ATPase [Xanthomonas campestris pv. campestris]|uniref:RIO1 family regulatory kinase/ATPase domain-containing protein n=1 Tax=Xanthomonas campestris TaxID=339 RepID=UPI000676D281|nr:RIO1 family regulatory kinase/ATPase [Xanthomonas campestris]AKS21815.1 kinase [Xanthomonas campestris pv. campestris]ALE70368.1 kinase [Xanthomonas campestris pv. campestris]MCF8792274.1 kinase [Xanthomonas campestris pv. campestris]MCF8872378.1 kinase [Xanthomonas campestris pv. campestris]MCF8875626.1 kinase [Xanthomonas campestris pv. campestris]
MHYQALDTASLTIATPVLLKQGTRLLEPTVYRTHLDGQLAVVKDYSRYRRTLLAPIARLMLRHEANMLRRLQGWKHAPALLGTLGGLALGMEFIPGDTLSASAVVGQEVFQQLQHALRRLHAVGITHNDLHGTNVVVSAGVPVLIDFTSAWRFPRWLRRSTLSRQLQRSDVANFQKMRRRLVGIAPSDAEAALTAEPGWVRGVRNGWKRLYRRLKGGAA